MYNCTSDTVAVTLRCLRKNMVKIRKFLIAESEIHFTYIQSSGPGGQNVNKVASACRLSFNVSRSPSLTEQMKARLLLIAKNQINSKGDLIIKAERFRTQERNKQDARVRLMILIEKAALVPKKRKKTKPSVSVLKRRLEQKKLHGKMKALRKNKNHE